MFIENPSSQIQKNIHLDCPICYSSYDDKDHIPMMICPNQHNCCNQCLDNLFRERYIIQCPDCRQQIRKREATKFRLLDEIRLTTTQLNAKDLKIKQLLLKLRTDKIELSSQLQTQKTINKELQSRHKTERQMWQKKINSLKKMKDGNKIFQNTTKQKLKKIVTNKRVIEDTYNGYQRKLDSNETRIESRGSNQNYKDTSFINPEYDLLHGEILKSKMKSSKKSDNLINKTFNQQNYKHQQRYNTYSVYQSREERIQCITNKNARKQRNKSMVKLKGSGKIPLPYFILNKNFTHTQQLIRIGLEKNKEKQYPQRYTIIQTLKDYNFTQLIQLNLSNSELRNIHFTVLQNQKNIMPSLQYLNLKKNRLESFPLFIFSLSNLRLLILNHNYIDNIPLEIQKLQKLQSLKMWNNKLTKLPIDLSSLQNLQILEFSNNKITELPYFLLNMKMLNQIDIFGNRIDRTSNIFKQFREKCIQKNITVIYDSETLTSEC